MLRLVQWFFCCSCLHSVLQMRQQGVMLPPAPSPALQARPGGFSDPLTSFTEMNMAQMSTNILPKSCSHPILCVRAKGCGRAYGGRERNG